MEKDIRFNEKKVDESWKKEVSGEKGKGEPRPEAEPGPPPTLSFAHFLTSLGYQVLMHLGELPHPQTQERGIDLGAAKETIDLLILLESKTKGNRTPEEDKLLKNLLPELQMKFVERASPQS